MSRIDDLLREVEGNDLMNRMLDDVARDRGRRIDHYVRNVEPGRVYDIGWGTFVVHVDEAKATRTCKGCGVSVTTAVHPNGTVETAEVHHRGDCPVVDRLGNNPVRS